MLLAKDSGKTHSLTPQKRDTKTDNDASRSPHFSDFWVTRQLNAHPLGILIGIEGGVAAISIWEMQMLHASLDIFAEFLVLLGPRVKNGTWVLPPSF